MHGFQICPISVKVSWIKLFPEDVHDDNDDNEEGGEVFPVKLAIKSSPLKKYYESRGNSPKNTTANSKRTTTAGSSSPSRYDFMSASEDNMDQSNTLTNENMSNTINNNSNSMRNPTIQGKGGVLVVDGDVSGTLLDNGATSFRSIDSQATSVNEEVLEINNGHVMSHHSSQDLTRPSTNSRPSINASTSRTSTAQSQPLTRNRDVLLQNPGLMLPLSKTYLTPLLEKPSNVRTQIKRQNNIERLNAQEISPQMTLFLTSTMSSTSINKDGKDIEIDALNSKQTFRRTVPVQWCPAGGSDTHQKRVVATDLHSDFSVKLKQSQQEFQYQSYYFHHEKIKAVSENHKTLEKILTSGPTNISRLSLDLIRRQRALRGNKEAKNGVATETPQTHIEELDLPAIAALA
eukprot:CAMPEP_0173163866 /NCGR_PEP_ID=MMETSP1105-20130129/20183_1 /TAXON_ID=2985 /ORGANISM="Ochromonas sp., Strain BG-1" /LENGTH=403 /DNA_ID=CAMNT_0014084019 /DNA_START=194 /DNA_END=1405 /DNA_ORIENTATION=-